jgi:glycerol kinase
MEKEARRLQKIHLALAVAEGESIIAWAQENGVPERTAQRWAQDRNVRREVDACRRRALHQTIGRLTGMAMNAVDGIAHLGKGADSESVQLRAWRGVLADLMSVSKFSVLEYRMTELEEQISERTGHTAQALKPSARGDGPCPRAGTLRPMACPALYALAPRPLPRVKTRLA